MVFGNQEGSAVAERDAGGSAGTRKLPPGSGGPRGTEPDFSLSRKHYSDEDEAKLNYSGLGALEDIAVRNLKPTAVRENHTIDGPNQTVVAKQIKLTRGHVAIVDDSDYAWLGQWKWSARKNKGKRVIYAFRNIRIASNLQIVVQMHRVILGAQDGEEVDHRDLDGLNNQRHNLRKCSGSQNCGNKAKREGCSSRFKGVYFKKSNKRWIAQIGHVSQKQYIGCFTSEEMAARAYDNAALALFGEYARVNFPNELPTGERAIPSCLDQFN